MTCEFRAGHVGIEIEPAALMRLVDIDIDGLFDQVEGCCLIAHPAVG